jgi:hypothetical protein
VGKLLLGFIFYINRNYIKTLNEELVKWYNLSVEALERGDSGAFLKEKIKDQTVADL